MNDQEQAICQDTLKTQFWTTVGKQVLYFAFVLTHDQTNNSIVHSKWTTFTIEWSNKHETFTWDINNLFKDKFEYHGKTTTDVIYKEVGQCNWPRDLRSIDDDNPGWNFYSCGLIFYESPYCPHCNTICLAKWSLGQTTIKYCDSRRRKWKIDHFVYRLSVACLCYQPRSLGDVMTDKRLLMTLINDRLACKCIHCRLGLKFTREVTCFGRQNDSRTWLWEKIFSRNKKVQEKVH